MDPIEEITRAQAFELVDEDGRPVSLELAPGLHAEQIAALEREIGCALPAELRRLLAHTAGIDGALEQIDFTGRSVDVALDETFPSGLPIAGDGFGNFWVADLAPAPTDAAKVFFACHDPPVILYQGPSIAHFLHETFRMSMPPHASLVDDIHEDRIHNVWGTNPGVIGHAQALEAEDDVLRAFAAALEDDFQIVDLRGAEIGMGFSWGRHGPRTELRRHGDELLFAYRRPPQRPRRGLFRRR